MQLISGFGKAFVASDTDKGLELAKSDIHGLIR